MATEETYSQIADFVVAQWGLTGGAEARGRSAMSCLPGSSLAYMRTVSGLCINNLPWVQNTSYSTVFARGDGHNTWKTFDQATSWILPIALVVIFGLYGFVKIGMSFRTRCKKIPMREKKRSRGKSGKRVFEVPSRTEAKMYIQNAGTALAGWNTWYEVFLGIGLFAIGFTCITMQLYAVAGPMLSMGTKGTPNIGVSVAMLLSVLAFTMALFAWARSANLLWYNSWIQMTSGYYACNAFFYYFIKSDLGRRNVSDYGMGGIIVMSVAALLLQVCPALLTYFHRDIIRDATRLAVAMRKSTDSNWIDKHKYMKPSSINDAYAVRVIISAREWLEASAALLFAIGVGLQVDTTNMVSGQPRMPLVFMVKDLSESSYYWILVFVVVLVMGGFLDSICMLIWGLFHRDYDSEWEERAERAYGTYEDIASLRAHDNENEPKRHEEDPVLKRLPRRTAEVMDGDPTRITTNMSYPDYADAPREHGQRGETGESSEGYSRRSSRSRASPSQSRQPPTSPYYHQRGGR